MARLISTHNRFFLLGLLVAALFVLNPKPSVLGQDGASKSRSGRQHRSIFVFYQELEVEPFPFSAPTFDAVWHGKGRFMGSRRIYDLEVRLNTTKKFANTPEPGVITVTEMRYIISYQGNVVKELTMEGTADLNNKRLLLSEVSGRSMLRGSIQAIWTHPNFPTPPVKGPELVCGFLLVR